MKLYCKYGVILLVLNILVAFSIVKFNPMGEVLAKNDNDEIVVEEETVSVSVEEISSEPRRVEVETIDFRYELSEEDYTVLLKIVEAEAGGEDETGKILVANVVMNRVESEKFPDSVSEVVYQRENGKTQFSPVKDGRINKVKVSEETVTAVNKALGGQNESDGAMYFVSRKKAASDKMKWFDLHLTKVFEHGGHEFFK